MEEIDEWNEEIEEEMKLEGPVYMKRSHSAYIPQNEVVRDYAGKHDLLPRNVVTQREMEDESDEGEILDFSE